MTTPNSTPQDDSRSFDDIWTTPKKPLSREDLIREVQTTFGVPTESKRNFVLPESLETNRRIDNSHAEVANQQGNTAEKASDLFQLPAEEVRMTTPEERLTLTVPSLPPPKPVAYQQTEAEYLVAKAAKKNRKNRRHGTPANYIERLEERIS